MIKTRVSLPLEAIRRPRDTPACELESPLRCRSSTHRRRWPPVRLVKLTEAREINPYARDDPGDER